MYREEKSHIIRIGRRRRRTLVKQLCCYGLGLMMASSSVQAIPLPGWGRRGAKTMTSPTPPSATDSSASTPEAAYAKRPPSSTEREAYHSVASHQEAAEGAEAAKGRGSRSSSSPYDDEHYRPYHYHLSSSSSSSSYNEDILRRRPLSPPPRQYVNSHVASATAHFRRRPRDLKEEDDEEEKLAGGAEGVNVSKQNDVGLAEGGKDSEECTFASFRAQIRREVEEETKKMDENELARTRQSYRTVAREMQEEKEKEKLLTKLRQQEQEEKQQQQRATAAQHQYRQQLTGNSYHPTHHHRSSAYASSTTASAPAYEAEYHPRHHLSGSETATPPTATINPISSSTTSKMEEKGGAGSVGAAQQSVIHTQVHKALHNHQQMLYVDCIINHRRVRACVDTGASTTVMSLAMARECGLLSHIDTSIVGGVKGVGFAKILGCVHEAKIRLGKVQVQTRVSIIDSLSPPFVIGLDVLRHCRCDISFNDRVLILRTPGGAVEQPREETVPFSIGAAPRAQGEKGGGGAGDVPGETEVTMMMREDDYSEGDSSGTATASASNRDDEPLGSLPPSRGGVSMAGV